MPRVRSQPGSRGCGAGKPPGGKQAHGWEGVASPQATRRISFSNERALLSKGLEEYSWPLRSAGEAQPSLLILWANSPESRGCLDEKGTVGVESFSCFPWPSTPLFWEEGRGEWEEEGTCPEVKQGLCLSFLKSRHRGQSRSPVTWLETQNGIVASKTPFDNKKKSPFLPSLD